MLIENLGFISKTNYFSQVMCGFWVPLSSNSMLKHFNLNMYETVRSPGCECLTKIKKTFSESACVWSGPSILIDNLGKAVKFTNTPINKNQTGITKK